MIDDLDPLAPAKDHDDLYCPHSVPWEQHCDFCPPPSDNGQGNVPKSGHFEKRSKPSSLVDRMRQAIVDTDTVRAIPPPEPLVGTLLARDSLAVLYGPSGGHKTFLAVDWALSLATGSWWHGHEVDAGPVLYVIAEGVSGIGKRIDAWTTHNGIYDLGRHHPVHWLPQAIDLYDRTHVAALTLIAEELQPVLVVFDTLARNILGAEENSAKDMGAVVANLDRIRRATGACVLAVHHTGKDTTAGARGSSAVRAAMDTELEVVGADDRVTLKVTKQKDSAEAAPVRLARITVDESCVLVPSHHVTDDDDLPAGVLDTLEALRRVAVPEGVPAKVWEQECTNGSFYRHRKRLVEAGLARNIGTGPRPRYIPADTPDQPANLPLESEPPDDF